MKINREVVTDVRNILSIVACGFCYGHRNQIFDHFAANIIETLTVEEIDEYARELADQDGYTEKDYEEVRSELISWFQKSFKGGKAI